MISRLVVLLSSSSIVGEAMRGQTGHRGICHGEVDGPRYGDKGFFIIDGRCYLAVAAH